MERSLKITRMISSSAIKTELKDEEGMEGAVEEEVDPLSLSPTHSTEDRLGPVQDIPEDLSVKKVRSASPHSSIHAEESRSSGSPGSQGSSGGEPSRPKRIKPIPPPLDLNARTLSPSDTLPQALPRSPADLPRECLPLRKRAVVNVKEEEGSRLNLLFNPSSLIPSSLSLTPSSGSSAHVSGFTHFPVPPPLIPVPGLTSPYPKSPFLSSTNGFPTPPTDLHSPGYPWASPTLTAMGLLPAFSPLPHSPLPFPTSSLLSPSPSYHSSSNSSREDLPTTHHLQMPDSKGMLTAPQPRYGHVPGLGERGQSSPAPSSPLLSPLTRTHAWPIPAWQCFMSGSQVRFLLPATDTPWQKAEELGWKDRLALKVDSRNPYQYAPNGLVLTKVDVVQSDANISTEQKPVLRLRMSPHNVPDISKVEMLAECALDHPFFVKDKGWCSARPRQTLDRYGIPCQDLSTGDICLPPNHPEAVKTPDLCDRFKRFEFSSADLADQLSPGGPRGAHHSAALRHNIASLLPGVRAHSMMSPPMSPAKHKKAVDPDKPKRPMNGFMLFAKKFRLELIQAHPGKDNRAISVLLGEAWKGLPVEERDVYSGRAKVLADEQKKLYPDCWKRKRSLSSATAPTTSQSAVQSPIHLMPPSPSYQHSMPGTPTSLHPLSYHTFSPLSLPPGMMSSQPVGLNPS